MALQIHSGILFFLFVLCLGVDASLPEGAPCMADGYPGTCRLWRKCFSLVLVSRDNEFPPLCSYDGMEPIICCTGCRLVEDVSKAVINPRGGYLWKTNQKSWNKCIDYFVDLPYYWKEHEVGDIVKHWNDTLGCFQLLEGVVGAAGGREAGRSEFPHMALLGYGPKSDTNWLCGGTLISERFILTAGHCISSPYVGRVRYVALGMLKRSDPQELWQTYRIQRIIAHPLYRPPSKYHDIALLKTRSRISFNKNVMPACLPNLALPVAEEMPKAFATGWGNLGPGTQPADTMQVVMLSRFSKAKCSNLFKRHRLLSRGYSHTTQMCFGDETKVRDTCEGDSGGPLQTDGQVYPLQRTVVGVTSSGRECGVAGRAGVYTRVRPYVPWIDRVVWG